MGAEVADNRLLIVEPDSVATSTGPEGSGEDLTATAGKGLPFDRVDSDIELPHHFWPIRIGQGNAEGPTQ